MAATDTIAALATGSGNSALAVIRISGENVHEQMIPCLLEKERFISALNRRLHLFTVIDPNSQQPLDQVTLIKFQNPASYTGENMVEITCHGGQVVIELILKALIHSGIRYADRGEFTRRALQNGKIDLLKAESINALINSTSQEQHRIAIKSYNGLFDKELFSFRERLLSLFAVVEAQIEFPEEDDILESENKYNAVQEIGQLSEWVSQLLEKRNRYRIVDKGLIIAIIGCPNSGKSSLFNYLLGQERSLVHWRSGTTRDWISETLIIAGKRISLVDTAGVRDCNDDVELMGIGRSWEHVQDADIVIWVTPANEAITDAEIKILESRKEKSLIGIINKVDLGLGGKKRTICEDREIPAVEISLHDHIGLDGLNAFIEKSVNLKAPQHWEDCLIINDRQEAAMDLANSALKKALCEFENGGEVISYRLRDAISAIEMFTGSISTEQVLENIFNTFCVGK